MSRAGRIVAEDAARIVAALGPALDPLAGTTLLVTGAGGFLCSYLVDCALAWNRMHPRSACRVLALDNYRRGTPERLAHLAGESQVHLLTHDVCEPLALAGRVDWIVHGASIASPSHYRRLPLETIDANVGGTRRMLDLAHGQDARGLVVLSSSEIYGDPDPAHIPTPESYRGHVSCTGPRACYDESKRLAETLAMSYFRLYGTPVKIVRPFNVYGPGQRLDDRRILPDLLRAVLAPEDIVLYSDGRATRAYCYVSDAIRALWLILLGPYAGEAFNVGNDAAETSVETLARLMLELAAVPGIGLRHAQSADADYTTDNPQRRCPDLTRLRAACDWRPEVDLRTGLARTLAAYREQEPAS